MKAKLRGSVVVVETVYHQPPGDQPKAVDSSYVRRLDNDEQMFGPRRVSIGIEWKPLDTGWLSEASVLVLKHEGRFDADEAKIIDLGIQVGPDVAGVCELFHGQSIRLIPSNLAALRVRCRSGVASYLVSAFPK